MMKKSLFILLCTTSLLIVGCEDKNGAKLSNKAPENVKMVDLGLPSGIKWANMNVGATVPEGYGNYYAWGETTPKRDYSWSTYKWINGSNTKLTKYCTNSEYGTVDNKTVLDLKDDAAHTNWGGIWRMPTKAEQDELRNNCTWKWTSNYDSTGIAGYIVYSKQVGNKDSIFIPAAGSHGGSDFRGAGTRGDYWSASVGKDYIMNAYDLYFNSSNVDSCYYSRSFGLSVRAVADSTLIVLK